MRNRLKGNLPLKLDSGVALIIAISFLGIFSLLGMYYVRSSEIELKRVNLLLDELRIREFVHAGLNEVVAEIEKHWTNGTIEDLLNRGEYEIGMPYYTFINVGEGKQILSPSDVVRVALKVRVFDESGKININLAPASVIQKLFGVNGEIARNFKAKLDMQSGGKWLYVLDEIFERGIPFDEELNVRINQNVSTWNAGDPSAPIPYLNINKATPEVLKALFNLSDSEVERVVSMKPFDSFENFVGIIKKDPISFNVKIGELNGEKWFFPFTGKSSSFKIVLEGELRRGVSGVTYNRVKYSLEVGIVIVDGRAKKVWNRVLRST
ncbi:MAG: general secretion pathway protein GspK [Candidatus Hydrogenedentes bacterium]|nr:general secretion pathway protein GspK [Candidatus Hydrogenedentota bacterium]